MRHLPLADALPTRPASTSYLVIKQDNNGDTFIVTAAGRDWIGRSSKSSPLFLLQAYSMVTTGVTASVVST